MLILPKIQVLHATHNMARSLTLVSFACLFCLFCPTLAGDQDALFQPLRAFDGPSFSFPGNKSNVRSSILGGIFNLWSRQECDSGFGLCIGISLLPFIQKPLAEVLYQGSDYCCPIAGECCSPDYCAPFGANCCEGGTYCPSAYECCHSNCAPGGSVCCPDGNWCPSGNECIVDQATGQHYCCTTPYCTAYVNLNGATIQGEYIDQGTYINANTLSVATTAPAPATATATAVYQYYYWTFTWYVCILSQISSSPCTKWHRYFYSYYYTFYVPLSITTITSTYVTTTTIVSAYATNSAEASSSFQAISATYSFPTPTAATSALASIPTATSTFPSFSAHSSTTSSSVLHAGGSTGSASRSVCGTGQEILWMIACVMVIITTLIL